MPMDENRRSYSGACIGIPSPDVLRRECLHPRGGPFFKLELKAGVAVRQRLIRLNVRQSSQQRLYKIDHPIGTTERLMGNGRYCRDANEPRENIRRAMIVNSTT
jgi:hypothetical protein